MSSPTPPYHNLQPHGCSVLSARWDCSKLCTTQHDYYRLLGLEKHATTEEIAASLSTTLDKHQNHPDLHTINARIRLAHGVLSNPFTKKYYDDAQEDVVHGWVEPECVCVPDMYHLPSDICLWCHPCTRCPFAHDHPCERCERCYACKTDHEHKWSNIRTCECNSEDESKFYEVIDKVSQDGNNDGVDGRVGLDEEKDSIDSGCGYLVHKDREAGENTDGTSYLTPYQTDRTKPARKRKFRQTRPGPSRTSAPEHHDVDEKDDDEISTVPKSRKRVFVKKWGVKEKRSSSVEYDDSGDSLDGIEPPQ